MEKSDLSKVARALPPTEYPAMVCGSCHWRRDRNMFGRVAPACMCMPPQVICIPQPQGAQIITAHPVIENLSEDTCAMWKPLEEDTQ